MLVKAKFTKVLRQKKQIKIEFILPIEESIKEDNQEEGIIYIHGKLEGKNAKMTACLKGDDDHIINMICNFIHSQSNVREAFLNAIKSYLVHFPELAKTFLLELTLEMQAERKKRDKKIIHPNKPK